MRFRDFNKISDTNWVLFFLGSVGLLVKGVDRELRKSGDATHFDATRPTVPRLAAKR